MSVCRGSSTGNVRLELTHICLMKTLARMMLKEFPDYMVKEYLEMEAEREILGNLYDYNPRHTNSSVPTLDSLSCN